MYRFSLWIALPTLWACDHDVGLYVTEKVAPGYGDTGAIEASVEAESDTAWEDTAEDTEPFVEEPSTEPQPASEPSTEPPEEPVEDPPEDDCDHTSDLIYAIDSNSDQLYLFDPQSHQFQSLGVIDCGMFVTPESMSVARNGLAYVRSGSEVYEVDVQTLDCQPTSYNSPNFGSFGMGFSTVAPNTWEEALFIANGSTLAQLDTQNWQLSPVGNLPSQSELTGNAAGELWAFFPLEQPAQLSRLSRSTAQIQDSIVLPQFPSPYDIDTFAFATWNGDFYLFVRTYGMGSSTDVYKVTASGSMIKVVEDSGLNIVGAGVSTCAPE